MSTPNANDSFIMEELGNRIQQYRLKLNISQADLANRVGLARKTITNLETGRGATLETLISVLRGLGLLHNLSQLVPPPEYSGVGENGEVHRRRRARRRRPKVVATV
jgi:DNA-binding XRE family transcriptional regulator